MKLKLVAYWQSSWRFWSVRFSALGALLWGYFLAFPDAAIGVWNMFPPELRSMLVPAQFGGYLSLVLFSLTILARVVHQPKAAAVIDEKLVEKQVNNGAANS